MSESVIELRDAVKRYESGETTIEALKGVNFAAGTGEFLSIYGPSGSGKSTMLNLLGLLDSPTEGAVYLDGADVTDAHEDELTEYRRETIGFVFQDFHLLPMLSAVENVELPSMWDRSVDRRDRAVDLLRRVGLGERLTHTPTQLSGGQRQRVAIARALVNEPRIVLADEPTGNLDQETSRTILEELTEIVAEGDVTVITVTHDPTVRDYADRVVELLDGVIQ